MIVWKFKPSYLAGTQTRGWFMTSGKQYGLFLEIKCERRTGRRSSKAPHLLLSQRPRLAPDFSWLQWVLQRGDKWEKNPRVINIIRLHHHRFPPFFPPQLSLPRQKKPTTKKKNARHTCTTSAVNNSVPPKVNFQFAQWRVTITLWPANCISPLIPYHFISGSLCSLNWGWLYLVVAICLLFSRCLDVQPDCIREREGQQENGTTWPW